MCRFCWQAISLLADWLQCFEACVQASLKKVSSCLWARMSFIKDWTFWGPSLIYQLLNQGFLFWPVLLNVSQPCASSSGCLVFSSLVLFFVSFPSVINLHLFFWSLTLCVYSLHSVRIQGKQISEALFPYGSLVSGALLHNFCISQPLSAPIFALSAQGDHDSLNRLPFLVLQSGNGPKAEIQGSSWAHLTCFPSLWFHSPILHAAYCLPAFKYVK